MTLISGNITSNKEDYLIREYLNLINSGVNASEILFLCQSPFKKKIITEKIKKELEIPVTKPNIYTFLGLCYNFISDYWPILENKIKDKNAKIEPSLCGLEISSYIFKNSIEEFEFKGYNSKKNLLHQLLRRYSLICQNALNKEEIKKKSKLMNEAFLSDINNSIDLYRRKTLELRAFDYLRQLEAFSFIYKNIKNPYKYIFLDDGDEITPVCFEYLRYIKPTVEKFFISYDKNGSSREGYLAAAQIDFEKFLNEIPIELQEKENGDIIFNSIKNKIPVSISNIESSTFVKKIDEIDNLIQNVNSLLKKGISPNEIGIITPNIDYNLKFLLKSIKAPIFTLSGSEKLNNNSCVSSVLIILKIMNEIEVSPHAKKSACLKIFKDENKNIEDLIQKEKNNPLSKQFYEICTNFIELKKENRDDIQKLNQTLKQIRDFENILGEDFSKKYLLNQLENTIISENPIFSPDIIENSIVLSTPQKFIDSGIKTKYQFWIDSSSDAWIKQDIGPLYNAWIFQKGWHKNEFTLSDNIELTLDKTSRILRKLYLSNSKKGKIYITSSSYDFRGCENFTGIEGFFELKSKKSSQKNNSIIPRQDQKPVLSYKKGRMGINAVAGSGKTTIMLALIMKLLSQGIKSENIFVLTFMESAARNFKERIKKNLPDLKELPHISTIHGLALRILKENNNYSLVGLSDDFEIIDEMRSFAAMSQILGELGIEKKKTDFYTKVISTIKMEGNSKKSPLNSRIYNAYTNYLKENNLIDYDDLLIYALKILKENQDVLLYYQDLAHYVIEDEAQDSSSIQQELIELLGGKYNNIIRCGDVNQSITATFTNSDVEGFRRFINENNCVKMDCSQRCAKKIYSLANDLIEYTKKKNNDAFLDVKMKPVEGKNPTSDNELTSKIFNNSFDEKNFVLNEIKKIQKKDKNSTTGILLRNNYLIDEWAQFLENNSVKTLVKKEIIGENPVFKTVLSILNFLETSNRENLLNCYKVLNELGFYSDDYEIYDFLKKNGDDFLLNDNSKFEFWWDLKYFYQNSYKSIFELALIIGDYYFSKREERVNITIISSLVESIFNREGSFEKTLVKLREISKKPKFKSVKLFETEEKKENMAELMTLHKSKGDEFDYVFIPELTKENLPLNPENIKLREETMLIENLKKNKKTEEELKEDISKENYRLLYVGITRAKKSLYLTSAKEYKRFYKKKEEEPIEVFENLLGVNNA